MSRWLAVLAVVGGLLGGCVTSQTGGLPQPAPKQERVRAYLDLARGLLNEGNLDRARDPLDRALALDPESVEAHVLKAVLSENTGETGIAESLYAQALRLDGDDAQALNNYGGFLLRQGRLEEALEKLRRSVEDPSYPRRSVAYENLGVAELSAGNQPAAKLAFARALSLDADLPRANLELASLEFAEGNSQIASDFYERYRLQARQTPKSLCLGINIARALGDRDRLASFSIALRNLYPRSEEAKRCVGG
ncbi:MAG: type IV pilus biogenesis/stability protein PilW [Pseudomonadota bacterium]